MRSRRITMIAALPLAALVIAGCGGGGDDDSTSSAPVATTPTVPTLSTDELIAQGDAICAEVNAAVGSIGAGSTESASQTEQIADLYTGMVDSLKGLGNPEDETGYPEFIAAAEELSQAQSDAKLAAERGDESALLTAESSASSALSSFQTAASEYGFENCAEAPSAPTRTTGGATPPGGEAAPAEVPEAEEEAPVEEVAPEPVPETGGAGGTVEGGGTAGGGAEGGGTSGGIGPG